MPPSTSQSSFIPKRGAARTRRRKAPRQIFLFSILAYSLIFAALLAAGASYLYKNYLTSQMQSEITILNNEINTFSVGDLSRVSEFDLTLKRSTDRFANSASIASVLQAVDDAVVQPIQIESLSVERLSDASVVVVLQATTETFDGALFQRKILNTNQNLFSAVNIDKVSVGSSDVGQSEESTDIKKAVTFTVTLEVPVSLVPYRATLEPENLSANQQSS
jgi:hypothetical protein